MKHKKWTLIAIVLLSGTMIADNRAPNLSANIDKLVTEVANTASDIGYEYAEVAAMFSTQPEDACRLLTGLDAIRDKAGYRFRSIEARPEIGAMRAVCASHKKN